MKKALLMIIILCCVALSANAEELPLLSYGSKGEQVVALQEKLTELGYYTFRITGNYQENTQKAVRLFQADNGLQATGIADEQLQRLILSDEAMPKPTPTPSPTVPPPNLDEPFSGKVEYGAKGMNVTRIQTRLADLGFYHIEISGEFWGNTRNAVKEFQHQNGLAADGIVGVETWQTLFFAEDVVDASATPKPTPAPTPVPYRIEVDVTNQVTSIYGLDEMGTYTTLIKHMICSTGTEKDPTPPGTYTLNGATSRWCYFPKWGTHGQYWTRIDAYNAFHSVIYSEADPMALKTGSYTGLGKKASHGCIRLMLEDAKWIYSNCGKGTEVYVFEGKMDEELTKSLKIPPLDYSVMLPEPTPAPTESPVYRPDDLPPMPFKTLEKGAESEAVYWLQCRLAELGYYGGSITGGYYSGTIEAVKAFQRDHNLSPDGKAGKKTLEAVYESVLATPEPVAESILATGKEAQSTHSILLAPPSDSSLTSATPAPTVSPKPTEEPNAIPYFFMYRDERQNP